MVGLFIGYAPSSGGGWTGDLIIADGHDSENHVASEVYVKRFKSEELGIKKLQETFEFLCAGGSLRQEGHARRQPYTTRESRASTLGGVPSALGQVRGDSWQEEGGVADSSDADRDAVEAREDVWRMSGEFLFRHQVMSRAHLYVPKKSSVPIPSTFIDVVRETKNQSGEFGRENSVDDFWNIDEERTPSES